MSTGTGPWVEAMCQLPRPTITAEKPALGSPARTPSAEPSVNTLPVRAPFGAVPDHTTAAVASVWPGGTRHAASGNSPRAKASRASPSPSLAAHALRRSEVAWWRLAARAGQR